MEQKILTRRHVTVAVLMATPLLVSPGANSQTADKALGKKQLADLVATAKTTADHRRLAAHFRTVAAHHEAEAKEHVELAAKYKKDPTSSESKRPGSGDTAAHCLTFAEHCRKAAKTMSEMAAMHEEMAKTAK